MTAKRVEYYAKMTPTKHGWEARVYRKEWHTSGVGWAIDPMFGTRRWAFTDKRLRRKMRMVITRLRAEYAQEARRGYAYYPIEGQP